MIPGAIPRRLFVILAIVNVCGLAGCIAVLHSTQDHVLAYRIASALFAVSCWYQLYVGLWYFTEDVRLPISVGHWLALVAIFGTAGLSYALLPLGRLSRIPGKRDVESTRRRGSSDGYRHVARASSITAQMQAALLIIAALGVVASGAIPATHVSHHWATRFWTIPFVFAFLLWVLSLPIFIIRAIREEGTVAWLWCFVLVCTPILGSILYEKKHTASRILHRGESLY